jgi:prepilin peptidase CpaA
MPAMEPVSLLVLTTLLLLAIWKDIEKRQIPNALVLWGVITALVLSISPRGLGLYSALAGGVAGFLVFFVLYLFKTVGAGDVKLMAAVGLLFGWPEILKVCMMILLAGGLLALAWAIGTSRSSEVLKNIYSGLMNLIRAGQIPQFGQPLMNHVSRERVPYALAVGMGTAAHISKAWYFN